MRRILVVLAVLGLTLGVASPTYAKGPVDATLTGPGLAAPVKVGYVADGTHKGGLDELSQATRLWDLLSGTRVLAPSPPGGELGDKYRVTYDFGCVVSEGTTECSPLRLEPSQELYPFAAAGPQVYTPSHQTIYGTEMPNGWLPAGPGLVRTFEALGVRAVSLPSESTPVVNAPTAFQRAPENTIGIWSPGTVIGTGIVAAAALVGLWWMRGRGRAKRRPA